MKVHLAGYNVDTEILKEIEAATGKRSDLTPEVISASYARISRDPRPIEEIRQDARNEVEKSRKSNSTIIFRMGHHSVAEHAVFNFDISGVSRYAMEELEKFRLCSYTEKSQRYITLDKDFVIPDEIKQSGLEEDFIEVIKKQNEAYLILYSKLREYVFAKHSQLAKEPKNHNLLEGWAKEDARYVTCLASESQVGQTINARNLELLLRRFASHSLSEVKQLGRAIYEQVADVAPSIVIFHQANARDQKIYPELALLSEVITSAAESEDNSVRTLVDLVDWTKDADQRVAAALLHTSSDLPFTRCFEIIKKLDEKSLLEIYKTIWANMQFYDSMLREFEYADLTFDIVLSAACFGQLKRHRMATITSQVYDPSLGVTLPDAISEIGMEDFFQEVIDQTNKAYSRLYAKVPLAAAYVLTNAHRKRVLAKVNIRELYHISRLRQDAHAQWDIQNVATAMVEAAKLRMPLVCRLLGGKDKYNSLYQAVYNRLPEVIEAALPASRKIK